MPKYVNPKWTDWDRWWISSPPAATYRSLSFIDIIGSTSSMSGFIPNQKKIIG
jgi:hypothetical protein